MPHVIYLHSALTNGRVPVRSDRERRRILRFERIDVSIALGLAGLINLAMLALAATLFHNPGLTGIATSRRPMPALPGWWAAGQRWPLPSPCSPRGLSSSRGHLRRPGGHGGVRAPASAALSSPCLDHAAGPGVLAVDVSPTSALVLSQVVLSFGIPFALGPLVRLTSDRRVMGEHVNGPLVTGAAWAVAGVIIALNVYLLGAQFLAI